MRRFRKNFSASDVDWERGVEYSIKTAKGKEKVVEGVAVGPYMGLHYDPVAHRYYVDHRPSQRTFRVYKTVEEAARVSVALVQELGPSLNVKNFDAFEDRIKEVPGLYAWTANPKSDFSSGRPAARPQTVRIKRRGNWIEVEAVKVGDDLAVVTQEGLHLLFHLPSGKPMLGNVFNTVEGAKLVGETLTRFLPRYVDSSDNRREELERSFAGTPIGRWIDYVADTNGPYKSVEDFTGIEEERRPEPKKRTPRPSGQPDLVLINPVTHTLVSANTERSRAYLYKPQHYESEHVIGDGYLDGEEEYEIDDPDYNPDDENGIGTYRRSHSPNGVRGGYRGKGYGFLLYGSLSYSAVHSRRARGYVGICSPSEQMPGHYSRSEEASHFWKEAVKRGTAEEATIEAASYRTAEYTPSDGCKATRDEACREVTSGTLRYRAARDVVIQYMPAELFASKGVVLFEGHVDDEPSFPVEIATPVLLGLNLEDCTIPIARRLVDLFIERGLTPDEIEPLFRTLPEDLFDEVWERALKSREMQANGRRHGKRRRYIMNAREKQRAWDDFYGDLQKLTD